MWRLCWSYEWLEASKFVWLLARYNAHRAPFNPVALALGATNGYRRRGNALRMGKEKKNTKTFTIGVPFLFARWVYTEKPDSSFPFILNVADDMRRKMGKKKK